MQGRYLIYVPEIHPHSLVLFYVKGDSEQSYSIRDYSRPPKESVRYADEFHYTATQIMRLARRSHCHLVDGDYHNTTDFGFWHRRITSLNDRLLGNIGSAGPPRTFEVPADTSQPDVAEYPILDGPILLRSAKGRKRQDLHRILHSPNSEHYVTWNIFRLLQRRNSDWWKEWLRLAENKKPGCTAPLRADDVPEIFLWENVNPPSAYEAASRKRMQDSTIPAWLARANDPAPVEGDSEIDIVFRGRSYLIYMEAKLGADISARTTYDPQRNQIARNIDCVLTAAPPRVPIFWMITRDEGTTRSFSQLMKSYGSDPALLASALPHQRFEDIREISKRLMIFSWREVFRIAYRSEVIAEDLSPVLAELQRRI